MSTNMKDGVLNSISSIYGAFIKKREDLKAEKKAEEEKKNEEIVEEVEEKPKLSKKEKREQAFKRWETVISELTGGDIDYEKPKSSKKKYRKWIDDEIGPVVDKPKKKKKRNYNKEFAPELAMLKNIVAEQNRFNADLQRRYSNAAGPNTRDAIPLNKNLVELAAVINSGRSNSLSLLREIGSIKKSISDLYMKQAKLDADLGTGGGVDSTDLTLLGSSIMNNSIDNVFAPNPSSSTIGTMQPASVSNPSIVPAAVQNQIVTPQSVSTFDPSTWGGMDHIDVTSAQFEAIPHTIVVEYYQNENKSRFKAIRNDTKEELPGCPLPTCAIKTIDTKNRMAKDEFDQVYQLEIVA